MTKFILKLTILAALFASAMTAGGRSSTPEVYHWMSSDSNYAKDCVNPDAIIGILKKMLPKSTSFIGEDVTVLECKQTLGNNKTYLNLQKGGNTCAFAYMSPMNSGSTKAQMEKNQKQFITALKDCALELEKEHVQEITAQSLETAQEENQIAEEEERSNLLANEEETHLMEQEDHQNAGQIELDDGDNEFKHSDQTDNQDIDEDQNKTEVAENIQDQEEVSAFDAEDDFVNNAPETDAKECNGQQRANIIAQLKSFGKNNGFQLKECHVKDADSFIVEVEYNNEIYVVVAKLEDVNKISGNKTLRASSSTLLRNNLVTEITQRIQQKDQEAKLRKQMKNQEKKRRTKEKEQAKAQANLQSQEESVEETITTDNIVNIDNIDNTVNTDNVDAEATDLFEDEKNNLAIEDVADVQTNTQVPETQTKVTVPTGTKCAGGEANLLKITFGQIYEKKFNVEVGSCHTDKFDKSKVTAEISIGATTCVIPFTVNRKEGPTRKTSSITIAKSAFIKEADRCIEQAITDGSIVVPEKKTNKKKKNKTQKAQEQSTNVAVSADEDNNRITVNKPVLGAFDKKDDKKIATELFAKLTIAELLTGKVVYTQNVVSVDTQLVNGFNYSAVYSFNGKKCQIKAYSDFAKKNFKVYHDQVGEDNEYFLKNSEFAPFTEENCFDVYGSELARSKL